MENPTSIAVIIVAAGRGERAGRENGPKQYRLIDGKSVLAQTIEAFVHDSRFYKIIVVRHEDDNTLYQQAIGSLAEKVTCVIGGATRQASTLHGLEALSGDNPDYVLIHDGVRPFVDTKLIDSILNELANATGVLPALPVSDTLKRAGADGNLVGTVSRDGLYAAQTPQAFQFSAIYQAHRHAALEAKMDFTDDASIAEWAGVRVKLVMGSPDNIKLTWKRDLDLANERLSAQTHFPDVRTGNGYDVHSFVPGNFVTLCGVKIAHEAKLNGHSDSDVALHALTDALLATCGAGDIGTHFPPSDQQWKGAPSSIFIKHAAEIIRQKGGRIANVDVSLICEAPKIGPHREAMVLAIAEMLGLEHERISIKATTNEKLGFIGRGEGIAAIATASVVFPGSLA